MVRVFRRLLAALVLVFLLAPMAAANSAEPPCLTVVVTGAPSDLSLTLEFTGYSLSNGTPAVFEPDLELRAWERVYRFWGGWFSLPDEAMEHAQLRLSAGDDSFTCPIPSSALGGYNRLLSVQYNTRTLQSDAALVWRAPLLVAMRVVLTLALEGLVLYLAGYRQRRSWIIFLVVNLITQGLLNLAVQGPNSMYTAYLVLMFGEPLVFLLEMIIFALALRERSHLRAAATSLLANLLSLAAGGAMLLYLPI